MHKGRRETGSIHIYTGMKRNILTALALCAALIATAPAQEKTFIPEGKDLVAYRHPKNVIYHKGWTDFNKNGRKDPYEDPAVPVEKRIDDLLSQMTMEEKTCQMVTLYGYQRVLTDALPAPEWKQKIWKDGMGAIDEQLNGFRQWGAPPQDSPFVWPASRHAWALNEVQRWFVENTRLGIPVDFTNEGIRGVEAYKATDFPTQLALGHTWDRELIRRVGYITGREGRLLGYTNIYAPVLDVGRDQRWGRYEEVYGESPYLVGELGTAMVRGLQSGHQVAATGKHFIAYSNNKGAREGLARVDPQMGPRELENIHAWPWMKVIREAGLLGAMCSYNDYDGIPIESSRYWLTDRLRNQMGFRGYTVSDSDALEYLFSKHSTAKDMKEAVLQAVRAGLNVRCTFRSPDSFVLPLRELIREGQISMKTIDSRVRDILRVKFITGIFDSPYQTDLRQADIEVNSEENRRIALQASREGLVLLKNDSSLLPLSAEKIRKISVCGPNADATAFALTHYGPQAVEVTSVLSGIRRRIGADKVIYAKGCELVDATWPESEILPQPLDSAEKASIAQAVENARKSDVAIVVLGGGQRTCGENKSRTSLDLPGRQEALLEAVKATGKPVVMVLINGRPLSVNWAAKHVDAILEAWYPGAQGGTAVAEALFGDYNPGGKLTVTFPKSVGQIPLNFPCKPYSQVDGGTKKGPHGNQSRVNGPLFPFGFGLSYTTFQYSGLSISHAVISPADSVSVSCKITNTGSRSGDEVVQLYTRDLVSSVTTYEKNLRGFERIHLAPGETKTVTFRLHPIDLSLINSVMQRVVEPGDFSLMIGASSADIRLRGRLTVRDESASATDTAATAEYGAANGNAALLTDGDTATTVELKAGDQITFPLRDGATPQYIAADCSKASAGATLTVQLSSGGGQFIDIRTVGLHPGKQQIRFSGSTSSDLRIVLTKGSVTLRDIEVDSLRK